MSYDLYFTAEQAPRARAFSSSSFFAVPRCRDKARRMGPTMRRSSCVTAAVLLGLIAGCGGQTKSDEPGGSGGTPSSLDGSGGASNPDGSGGASTEDDDSSTGGAGGAAAFPSGTSDCSTIGVCAMYCNSGPFGCSCYKGGTPEAQKLYEAMILCEEANGCGAGSCDPCQAEWDACVADGK